jgi:hypothetical protein
MDDKHIILNHLHLMSSVNQNFNKTQRSPRISNRLCKPNLITLIDCFDVATIVSLVSRFLV